MLCAPEDPTLQLLSLHQPSIFEQAQGNQRAVATQQLQEQLLQTGFTLNYFTQYYANDYNPLLGEFYVQNETKIGDFPMLDFFVNARIRQTRLFLKAEHFNSAMTGFNFYSAPNYPYRDFMIRFGLVWNFFK